MEMKEMGVKESLEALEALRLLVLDVKKVLADGKISTADIGVVFDVLNQMPALNAGIKGVELVPAEIKDIDAQEAELLVKKALELAALVGVKV